MSTGRFGGPLLPDDERELLQTLAAEPRRLWEVTPVGSDGGLTVRDIAASDVIDVRVPT